jgi:GntR family transcriptional regulator/MocR family aminotransferase
MVAEAYTATIGRNGARVTELAVSLDPDSGVSLQIQLRRWIIDAISTGVLRPGCRLPSSRRLAERAGVSRNTVILAYSALMAEGLLQGQPRSGIFVAAPVGGHRLAVRGKRRRAPSPLLEGKVTHDLPDHGPAHWIANWHAYPYPFLDGPIDPELLPISEWREAGRLALTRLEASQWALAPEGSDDRIFLDELRSKVLPARGITAPAEEMLITTSARQALQMILDLLLDRGTPVLCDGGIDPQILARLERQQTRVLHGRAVGTGLPEGTIVLTSNVRAIAPDVARDRAREMLDAIRTCRGILIEHDPAPEIEDGQSDAPPLSLSDRSGRCIIVSSLSPYAACGTPPGAIIADPQFIAALRRIRFSLGAGIPAREQRAWAHFIGLGHYAAAVSRTSRQLAARRTELRDALNYYMRKSITINAGCHSSSYSVRPTGNLSVLKLATAAAAQGILIEPQVSGRDPPQFRMGVSGIRCERIRDGVQRLAALLRRDPADPPRRLSEESAACIRGPALRATLSGAVLLYQTVYGDPCTIEIHPGGRLVGIAGHHDEDCDTGRWWIEGDRWYRQWLHWVYGECHGFDIVVEGAQMRWYGPDGLLADTAVIADRRVAS